MIEHDLRRYKRGCRCGVCREANRLYARAYRAKNGIKRTAAQKRAERKYEVKRRAARRAKALLPQLDIAVVGRRSNKLKDE